MSLGHLSIRTKLYGLIPATLLTMSIALGIGIFVSNRYGIGGPVDLQMKKQQEFLSNVQPAVLVLTRPIILLQRIETEKDTEEIRRSIERFQAYEKEYRDARDHWLAELPPGEIRGIIERDLHASAEEIFRIANNDYFRELLKGANANRETVSKILRDQIMPAFDKQRKTEERLVELAKESSRKLQEEAGAKISFWTTTNFVVSILAVSSLVFLKYLLARSIVRATNVLGERMKELSSGASDLTARVNIDSKDELGSLAGSINAMIAKIQSVVSKVRESSVQVLATAAQIAATSKQQDATVSALSSSTSEVAAAVREISATSSELTGTMDEVNQRANQAATLASSGSSRLLEMEGTMHQLVESTASISSKLAIIREKADNINVVVTTITKVADQTNLLSINAAIEAEKAGEYGRGFLVVAREIRRLADQTAVATLDIENMVRHMQDAVSAGVMQMDKFSEEVRTGVSRVADLNQQTSQIIHEVQTLSDRFRLVNEGMRNQSIGVGQINDAMSSMATNIRQTATALEEFNRATAHLRDSVQALNQEIGQFKV